MSHDSRRSTLAGLLLAFILALGFAPVRSEAQSSADLLALVSNGTLTVSGFGFKPGEQAVVTSSVAGGAPRSAAATADAYGNFYLRTDIPVPAGASLQLTATGNQGTTASYGTTAARPAGGGASSEPSGLPTAGGAGVPTGLIVVAGFLLLGAGLALRRYYDAAR